MSKKTGSRSHSQEHTPRNPSGVSIVQKRVYKTPNTTRLEILVKKIGEVPADKRFILKDGRLLKDMVELSHALEHMSDDVFNHHVNSYRNDFKNWVADVFGEKELASQIEKAKTRADMQLAILKHIVKTMF